MKKIKLIFALSLFIVISAKAQRPKSLSCQGIHITKPNPVQPVNVGFFTTWHDTLYLPISGGVLLEAQFNYNCHTLINPLVVEWYRNGVLIASGTPTTVTGNYIYQSFYTTLLPGDYQALFQGYYFPANTRTVTVLPNVETDIKENIVYENTIFPNPSVNSLTIENKNISYSKNDITIFDLSGKEMAFSFNEESAEKIILNYNIEPGIYFLKLNSEKGTAIRKLIITR
ncbi:MAG: T9SS type A sorting domain-containing protein [Bacteroidetes bacterium]|nr:T9SS type A sorting domain-containing protein [Bacteroidota bacterium]